LDISNAKRENSQVFLDTLPITLLHSWNEVVLLFVGVFPAHK